MRWINIIGECEKPLVLEKSAKPGCLREADLNIL